MKKVRQLTTGLMDLLFPPSCPICQVRLDPIQLARLCRQCSERINYVQAPLCRICGIELIGEKEREFCCGACLRQPPPYTLARSLVRYEPEIQHIIQQLKFGSNTSVRAGLMDIISQYDFSLFQDCDLIVPVPLHRQRLRVRGLNQATFIAKLFFPEKISHIDTDCLVRVRNTVAQTNLGGAERRTNLAGAFTLRPGHSVQRRQVCLVDDVFTTGTTVSECARLLVRHGAMSVRIVTLARAGGPHCDSLKH